jgi:hypothetical protein
LQDTLLTTLVDVKKQTKNIFSQIKNFSQFLNC